MERNGNASAELTSTHGSLLTTGNNDATQNLVGDSVPSSSSDANLQSNFEKTIQDDPISSTSDSVSTFNFSEEKKDASKELVSDTDFFSSELNMENITTEKIPEDVEDIANDLENLLGETNNDFVIPISTIRDDGELKNKDFNDKGDNKENFNADRLSHVVKDDKSETHLELQVTDKVDSTEEKCCDDADKTETVESSVHNNILVTKLIDDQVNKKSPEDELVLKDTEPPLDGKENIKSDIVVENTIKDAFQDSKDDIKTQAEVSSCTENDPSDSTASLKADVSDDKLQLPDVNKNDLIGDVIVQENIESICSQTNTSSSIETSAEQESHSSTKDNEPENTPLETDNISPKVENLQVTSETELLHVEPGATETCKDPHSPDIPLTDNEKAVENDNPIQSSEIVEEHKGEVTTEEIKKGVENANENKLNSSENIETISDVTDGLQVPTENEQTIKTEDTKVSKVDNEVLANDQPITKSENNEKTDSEVDECTTTAITSSETICKESPKDIVELKDLESKSEPPVNEEEQESKGDENKVLTENISHNQHQTQETSPDSSESLPKLSDVLSCDESHIENPEKITQVSDKEENIPSDNCEKTKDVATPIEEVKNEQTLHSKEAESLAASNNNGQLDEEVETLQETTEPECISQKTDNEATNNNILHNVNVLNEEKNCGKIEMTITSIIEEAIQDEHENNVEIPQDTQADNPVEEVTESVSQVTECAPEKADLLNIESEQIKDKSDIESQDTESVEQVSHLKKENEIAISTDLQSESNETENSKQVAVLHNQENEKDCVANIELTSEIENEKANCVCSKESSDVTLPNPESTLPEVSAQLDETALETQPVQNICEKESSVERTCEKEKGILSTPDTLHIIPDSVDEGNIAAMAICEPSNSDYYNVEVDMTSQTIPTKDVDQVTSQEISSLPELQAEPKLVDKFPSGDKIKIDDATGKETSDKLVDIDSKLSKITEELSKADVVLIPITTKNKNKCNSKKDSPTTHGKNVNTDSTLSVIIESKSAPIEKPSTTSVDSVPKVSDVKENPKKAVQEQKMERSLADRKINFVEVDKVIRSSDSSKRNPSDKHSMKENTDKVEVSNKETSSQIQPLVIDVESVAEVSEESDILTSQYSSKMSTKELLKMTITKHKPDSPKEDESILKIYDPKDDKKSQKVKESIPKLIIKPVVSSQMLDDPEQMIPKLLIKNMSPNRPCSPKVSKGQKSETSSSLKVTIKSVVKSDENQSKSSPKLNIKAIVKNDEEVFTPKITIKPIVKPEEEVSHSPKITIKPILKPDDETCSNPRITIKPIPKPEELSTELHSPRITIKPLIRLEEEALKEEERSHSPRVTIKPLKCDDSKSTPEEMVHSPRITIKPIKPPDEDEPSPKITIKPLIKPQEEERHEKKEGSPKIKIKPIVKPPEELPELIDFEEQIKQERIVLKINTKESRKREAAEEIEKLAKIKVKFSRERGRARIVTDQKLKRALEEPIETDNKRQKISTIDLSSSPDCKEIIEIKDDSNPPFEDPIESIPKFEIKAPMASEKNNPPPVTVTPTPPAPRKRGRPRKIPLVVREEFKDAKEEEPEPPPVVEETGRPKRSCRGQSVCTTLGIKPRKPRGGGAATTRGRGRGRGSRGGSRGSNRQQRVSARLKLLEAEAAADSSSDCTLVVDEIIEIPDDDPKEEEHPPQPLPQTQPEVIEVTTPTPPPGIVDSIAAEGITESVVDNVPSEGGSDVVLIEEETRMSADIHGSRAQTPAKHVLTTVDVEDTQSSVQSTATTESVKVVRKGSRLEVHQEPECDIISPEQLAEYYWSGSGPYMIQEQVAQFLGIKSFKRKYPGIQRRPVDMQERDYIRENCLASEPMCDMGLTAVASADILDIMYSDFQHKYEEYCKHQRDRHTKDIINKQKALNLAASQEKNKHDLTQQAVQSAAAWNITFNKSRREERKGCMDLQTLTVNYPRGKFKIPEKPKVGSYPIALVPGQYTDTYKEFTPNELYNLPLNTMMNQTLSIVRDDDSQSDGSGSDSDTTTSDSDTTSSDSSDEDCNLCATHVNSKKVAAN